MRRLAGLTAGLAALLVAAPSAGAAVPYTDLGDAAGPLTRVAVGADLSCQAMHRGDPGGEFAPTGAPNGDCGTLVAVDGRLYGPHFAAHDGTGTGALGSFSAYDLRGQAPEGADAVATAVDLSSSGVQVTQRDSYLPGQDAWRTDVTVTNTSGAPKSVVLYRAGDCFLGAGAGTGYGFAGSPDGSVGCSAQPNNAPLDRVQQWVPITPGATWLQASAPGVWSAIAARTPFAGECRECMNETDAAAGLSWAFTLAPGAAESRSHWTVLSPTGRTGPPLPVEPPPVAPAATTVQGTTIKFTGPPGCVTPPARYKLRVTSMRKKRISRDRFGYVRRVRILKVDFRLDGTRRATDKRAAFKALLPSTGAAPGAHALTANVTLQPLRERGRQRLMGKPFRRTLNSTVNVCG
jgi:hypothetical protein